MNEWKCIYKPLIFFCLFSSLLFSFVCMKNKKAINEFEEFDHVISEELIQKSFLIQKPLVKKSQVDWNKVTYTITKKNQPDDKVVEIIIEQGSTRLTDALFKELKVQYDRMRLEIYQYKAKGRKEFEGVKETEIKELAKQLFYYSEGEIGFRAYGSPSWANDYAICFTTTDKKYDIMIAAKSNYISSIFNLAKQIDVLYRHL